MTLKTIANRLRQRSILLSRDYKRVFLINNGPVASSAEHVLADLRSFCHVERPTIFDKDPIVMARREGRRETFVRIQRMLNLNEEQVQKLMEIDDGR
jgi:hypothetical protein